MAGIARWLDRVEQRVASLRKHSASLVNLPTLPSLVRPVSTAELQSPTDLIAAAAVSQPFRGVGSFRGAGWTRAPQAEVK